MNLFLLAAVPLAAIVLQRWLYPNHHPFSPVEPWAWGFVWSMVALIAVVPFSHLRPFQGNPWFLFTGQVWTDAILVPGLVVTAWWWRGGRSSWNLFLWLALVLSLAGVRDFAAATATYDATEYFTIPLARVLVLIWVPSLAERFLRTRGRPRVLLGAGVVGVVLALPTFSALSYAGWGWVPWILTSGGIATGLWFPKTKPLLGAAS